MHDCVAASSSGSDTGRGSAKRSGPLERDPGLLQRPCVSASPPHSVPPCPALWRSLSGPCSLSLGAPPWRPSRLPARPPVRTSTHRSPAGSVCLSLPHAPTPSRWRCRRVHPRGGAGPQLPLPAGPRLGPGDGGRAGRGWRRAAGCGGGGGQLPQGRQPLLEPGRPIWLLPGRRRSSTRLHVTPSGLLFAQHALW